MRVRTSVFCAASTKNIEHKVTRAVAYNESTGVQQCRHHDVCDSIFLKWQNERLLYLKEVVKPRIPKSYENLDGLRAVCLELCSNDEERNFVMKKKSIAPLEKWLKLDGRTRGMLLLLP
jgi:hypothetical protein